MHSTTKSRRRISAVILLSVLLFSVLCTPSLLRNISKSVIAQESNFYRGETRIDGNTNSGSAEQPLESQNSDKKEAISSLKETYADSLENINTNTSTEGAEDYTQNYFYDYFEGRNLDPEKWMMCENTNMSGYPANGGSVQMDNGFLTLSSSGSSFPFIYSTANPFPSSGDFEVEFAVTYTCIGDLGCGIMLSNVFPPLDTNWHNYKIITLWAHDQGPDNTVIYIEFFGSLVYKMNVAGFKPSSPQHIYKISYSNETYSIYVDGVLVGRRGSQQRPNTIVFGNPPNPEVPRSPQELLVWGYWGWSSFKIDYITVNNGNSNNDNSGPNSFLLPTQISLTTNVESQEIGYKVKVFGILTSNDKPIDEAQIVLFLSMPGVSVWQPLASVSTNVKGYYSASWLPIATGDFSLKAEYFGNNIFAESFNIKNISIVESASKDLFCVESNSTITSFNFNSTSQVSFTVSGPTGTKGYVRLIISKKIVSDLTSLKIYLDGNQLEYLATDLIESWQLYFAYSHSKHTLIIAMPQTTNNSFVCTTTLTICALFAGILLSLVIYSHKTKNMIAKQ